MGPQQPAARRRQARLARRAAFALQPIASGNEAAASFTIAQAGKLSLRVTDIDGEHSPNAFTAVINLLADERPFVRLLEPPALSFATPEASLPVVVAAEDDYGISRVEIFRSLNDSRALPLEVPLKTPPPSALHRALVPAAECLRPAAGRRDQALRPRRGQRPSRRQRRGKQRRRREDRRRSEFEQMERQRQGMELLLSKYHQAQRRMGELRDQVDQLRKKVAEQPDDEAAEKAAREALNEMAETLSKEAEALRKSAKAISVTTSTSN